MIEKLTIENFQSHKFTGLDFDPGVNIIVGSSDSGKTAIIRALRWLVWNRPSGEAFRSHWGGDTQVVVEIGDHIINRIKTDRDNLYMLDEAELKAFGANVPDDIYQVLNLDEINLQQQLDRPFLLTDSPGEVARYFNEVANLDKIDTGIKNVQREIRQIEQDTRSTEQTLTESQEELQKYEYLDKMEADVEVLEEMEGHIAGMKLRISRLNELIEAVTAVETNIEEFGDLMNMEEEVNRILTLREEKQVLTQNILTLDELINEWYGINSLIETNKKITTAGETVDRLLGLMTEEQSMSREIERLTKLVEKIKAKTRTLTAWKKDAKAYEDIFHEEMPDVCPLCNQKIKR